MQSTITISNFDESIARWLAAESAKRGVGADEIVLHLIRKQIAAESGSPTFHELDELFGTWNEQDAAEFERATSDFARIDEKIWR